MDKTSQKVTKDPKCVEAGRKGRKNFINKLKKDNLNDAKKVAEILPIQAMNLPALLTMQAMKLPVLLTMQAMKLPALPSVFVYFLHITLFSLKSSSMTAWWLSMSKNNHQKDVICFRKIYTINE